MTHEQYLIALKKLGLPPYGKQIGEVLGLSPRQAWRLAQGHHISKTIALLLGFYLRYGLPDAPKPRKPRTPAPAPEPPPEIRPPVSPMPSRAR